MDSEFKEALEVFEDSIIAQQLLGITGASLPKTWQKPVIDTPETVQERLHLLASELRGWVILKSQEMKEFEGEDLVRLRGEAVGCMYALRELQRHFSECDNT